MMDVRCVTSTEPQCQSSLLLLNVEGRKFDLTNLVPARKANNLSEPSMYRTRAELLSCSVEVDGINSSANGRSPMMRSQSCREAGKPRPSLYPNLKDFESSLDTQDVADIFSRLSRRKSTGTLSNRPIDDVSQADLLKKAKMKLTPTSSLKSDSVFEEARSSTAGMAFLTRAPDPPRSYSINKVSPYRQSDMMHNGVDESLPGALYANTSQQQVQSVAIERHRWSPEREVNSTTIGQAEDTPLATSPFHKIEVAPGVVMDLRGAYETVQAIDSGVAASVPCAWCGVCLLCVPDAEAVICPDCRVLTPVVEEEGKTKYLRRRGVGLGLQDDPIA
jgi:hypothetical protein